jgi:hypothetical protein
VKSTIKGEPGTKFSLPAASVTAIRGTISTAKTVTNQRLR